MLFRPYSDPVDDDFQVFWASCPRKEGGKLDAEKAYREAVLRATPEEILAGLERYKAHLPRERQYIVTPSSFLRRGMWMDEYDEPVVEAGPRTWECPHTIRCANRYWCDVLTMREARKAKGA